MNYRAITAISFALLFSAFAVPAANAADPADVTFWQSIQNSKNPAEYQAYLQTFPHGTFVAVAKLRIQELQHPPAPPKPVAANTPPAPPAPPAPVAGAVVGDGTIVVTPSPGRVGQQVMVTFQDFPQPAAGSDVIVVVPAGTPDNAPATQSLVKEYLSAYYISNGIKVGPFAPGAYEVRWLTIIYNNDKKLEIGARTSFSITR